MSLGGSEALGQRNVAGSDAGSGLILVLAWLGRFVDVVERVRFVEGESIVPPDRSQSFPEPKD